jgi:GNAT superfamily N-acetyltransferase
MGTELVRAGLADAQRLWRMQKESFSALYDRYRDEETNPACEPQERTRQRLLQPSTYYYFIVENGQIAGAIRIRDEQDGSPKAISPIFVLPQHRRRGIARRAIALAQIRHGEFGWELVTIREETPLRRLYEGMGYRPTGKEWKVNERMTLMVYQK